MKQWERADEGQRGSDERHWKMQLQVSYIYVATVPVFVCVLSINAHSNEMFRIN